MPSTTACGGSRPGRTIISPNRLRSGSSWRASRPWRGAGPRCGRPITLSAKEFALLELFVLNQGLVLDRSTITAHVWDDNHDPFANLLEVLVGRLRRKIDDGFEPKLIRTLRGAGYRFGP